MFLRTAVPSPFSELLHFDKTYQLLKWTDAGRQSPAIDVIEDNERRVRRLATQSGVHRPCKL